MTLPALARKFGRNVEDYGWWVAARKALAYCPGFVYSKRVYRIYRINLDQVPPRGELDARGFTFKILESGEEQSIQQIENVAEWLQGKLKDRVATGDLCLVALQEEKVGGFNVITFGEVFIPLINLKRTLRPGEAWSEHIAVQKEFRQKGLASELRYRIFEELRRRGIRRLYGGTLVSNLASLKLTRRVGFQEIVDVIYTKVLHFESWHYKRLRP